MLETNNNIIVISKYLSYVLRHRPQSVDLVMDKNGWVKIDELIKKTKMYKNIELTFDVIKQIVENDDKQRYKLSEDQNKIRANQGHSIDIDLQLEEKEPPEVLYHGTAGKYMESIYKNGLKPMNRQYVHLSCDENTAMNVGKRHGQPVILSIKANEMYKNGYKFYLSENNVWLTEIVPIQYLNNN